MPVKGKILVYLIGQHQHAMFLADIQHGGQFLPAPNPADRVMGGGHDEHAHLVLRDRGFKGGKIHRILPILVDQLAGDQRPFIIPHCMKEGIVYRREHHDPVLGLGKDLDQPVDGRHHPRGKPQPFPLHRIAMAFLFPIHKGLIIALAGMIVAEYAGIQILLFRLQHALGDTEIHIRHPQGQQILSAKAFPQAVPFFAMGALPIHIENGFVHGQTSLSPQFRTQAGA